MRSPSSTCSLCTVPGGIRGGFADNIRAGISGRATSRTRVRFMRGLPRIIEADVGSHAGAQVAAVAHQLDQDLERATGGIHHGTGLLDTAAVLFTGCVHRSHFHNMALAHVAKKLFWESKTHEQRAFSGQPEEAVSFGNVLSFAYIASGDQSTKRSDYFCLFQFQFKGAFFLLSRI